MGGVCRRGVLADLLTRSLNAVDELRCLRSRLALLSPWLSLGAKVIADLLLSCSPCLRVLAGCQNAVSALECGRVFGQGLLLVTTFL